MVAAALVVMLALAAAVMPWLMPEDDHTARQLAAGGIFAASYLALAIGKVPGLAIDRAGVALVGACLMVGCGALPLRDAYSAIDLDTITLLLGMMIVVANLRLSGFFALANAWVIGRAHRPPALLAAVTLVSGVFSAFLVNDAVCLVLTPLVLELTLNLKRNPVPYLLAVAMASNVGSTATITGNPQNIMIGSFSRIPYATFAAALAPIAVAGLVSTIALIALLHRDEFRRGERLQAGVARIRVHRAMALRAVLGTVVMLGLFFVGQPPAKVAIILGALLLLTRRVKSARIYAEIDWSLLLMFSGLFIIVAGAQHTLLTPDMVATVSRMRLQQVPVLSAVTAVLSNLREQCARGPGAEALHRASAEPRHRVARGGDGFHARGQLHRARLDRQSDRGREGGASRRDRGLLGLLPGRGAARRSDHRRWDALAYAMSKGRFPGSPARTGFRSGRR